MNATVDTGVGPNLIRQDALPRSYWHEVSGTKPRQLQSEGDTSLQVLRIIKFLVQFGPQVAKIWLMVVGNLVVGMLIGMTSIDKNKKSSYPKNGVVILSGSFLEVLKTQ